jgi:hypothetical protein
MREKRFTTLASRENPTCSWRSVGEFSPRLKAATGRPWRTAKFGEGHTNEIAISRHARNAHTAEIMVNPSIYLNSIDRNSYSNRKVLPEKQEPDSMVFTVAAPPVPGLRIARDDCGWVRIVPPCGHTRGTLSLDILSIVPIILRYRWMACWSPTGEFC